MKRFLTLLGFLLLYGGNIYSQNFDYTVYLESLEVKNFSGLQSYAFGQHDGKWLILGGRLDGLHRRQPWAAFTVDGNNNQIFVIDPKENKTWTASLSTLPTAMAEQLSSTNMEFYQKGDHLLCAGGYGYSATQGDHVTYAYLTIIDVPKVIDAVINNKPFSSFFEQIQDSEFQVCGGKLKTIRDTFYLLGGQNFMGRYNPMGPDHGPGFFQEYTNEIRRFILSENAGSWTVKHLSAYRDTAELHRRDYNAEAQIMPSGEQGVTMYSGVFKEGIDLPYLSAVNVTASGYEVQENFRQYYNHYHCGAIPLYSAKDNAMHTLFFGGIAQYYDNQGVLTQDDDVPFVNTIARVSRDDLGNMSEHKMAGTMPALLGAGSEFIPLSSLSQYSNGVIKMDELKGDSILVGYILGGIESDAPNIFFINTGEQSKASNQILKVYLVRDGSSSSNGLNEHSNSPLDMRIYPNPTSGRVVIQSKVSFLQNLNVKIMDGHGRKVFQTLLDEGSQSKEIPLDLPEGVYTILLHSQNQSLIQKLVVH
jgi:hypothetical protein